MWAMREREKRSVVDSILLSSVLVRIMVEDRAQLDLGSDLDVRRGRLAEGLSTPCFKWKVDGRMRGRDTWRN